jgi:hypothetical protein
MTDTQIESLVEYGEGLGLTEDEVMDALTGNYCPCEMCYEDAEGAVYGAANSQNTIQRDIHSCGASDCPC